MKTQTEIKLNPFRYYLSEDAKKRLRWLYILYYEIGQEKGQVSKAANKIGISRQWLSKIKSKFERNNKNPRCLEPESRAPNNTDSRQRILKQTEDKIIEIRDKYGCWGKDKISVVLKRDYGLKAGPSTVNRYLHKRLKIDPKISEKNKKAWREKKERDKQKEINLKIKYRPPTKIKDYCPGALIEKDMKLVPKINSYKYFNPKLGKYYLRNYFNYQHTFIDSFTRIRAIELTQNSSSEQAKLVYEKIKQRMPFEFATINTDNGGENEKKFSQQLSEDNVIHFYSKVGTPTDNPRVERSHLTDDKEFYQRGNINLDFKEQKEKIIEWENIYNWKRPHQALGYLTPMEFYNLWKTNTKSALKITNKYQQYLKQQRIRLANSRRIKKKEQIEKLMQFIDAKLERNRPKYQFNNVHQFNQIIDLQPYKLKLANCQLCSWT